MADEIFITSEGPCTHKDLTGTLHLCTVSGVRDVEKKTFLFVLNGIQIKKSFRNLRTEGQGLLAAPFFSIFEILFFSECRSWRTATAELR